MPSHPGKLEPLSDETQWNLNAPLTMAGREVSIKNNGYPVVEGPESNPVASIGDQVRNMLEELDKEFETNYESRKFLLGFEVK